MVCLAAMLGAEATRAGDGALPREGIEGGIFIAYAMAAPVPTLDSFRPLPGRAALAAARAAAALPRLSFDAPAAPPPAPRPFHAWPAPEPGYARALYAGTGARAPARPAGEEDFIEGFESGPGVRWDPAAAGGRFVLARTGEEEREGAARPVELDDDPDDRLADLLGVSSRISENTRLKLRYSNSRKRMKGVSVIFAWDF